MMGKHVTQLCARSQEAVILATVSELSRLGLDYLAVITLLSVLTMKHVWGAEEGQWKVFHPWSMEQRCSLLSLRVLHWLLLSLLPQSVTGLADSHPHQIHSFRK